MLLDGGSLMNHSRKVRTSFSRRLARDRCSPGGMIARERIEGRRVDLSGLRPDPYGVDKLETFRDGKMVSIKRGARRARIGVRMRGLQWFAIGSVSYGCLVSQSLAASVPWTPSLASRSDIEVLVDDAGLALTVSQWPLPRDAVQQALDGLPARLPPGLDAARERVQQELRAQQASRVGLTVRERHDALAGFGDDATPGSSLQLRSAELDGPHLAMQIGGRLDPVADSGRHAPTARLDDSAVAIDAFGVQAQAWAHRSWWGPGWQSALPLSNNAPALDGIGFQRAAATPSESPWSFVARAVESRFFPRPYRGRATRSWKQRATFGRATDCPTVLARGDRLHEHGAVRRPRPSRDPGKLHPGRRG